MNRQLTFHLIGIIVAAFVVALWLNSIEERKAAAFEASSHTEIAHESAPIRKGLLAHFVGSFCFVAGVCAIVELVVQIGEKISPKHREIEIDGPDSKS